MRQRIGLNRGWTFTERFSDTFLAGKVVSDLETVDLPHTCKLTPFDYFDESVYQMVCGYRKVFFAPESWRGKRVFLRIGAAGHSAQVYLNGVLLTEHFCGYTAFSAELTDHLRYGGDNLLVIRVDSREQQDIPPFGFVIDYMTYGGLYREVSLEITSPCHIADLFARPEVDGSDKSGVLKGTVTLGGAPRGEITLRHTVRECFGKKAVVAETVGGEEVSIPCGTVSLWDVDDPKLYTWTVTLLDGGLPVDEVTVRIGFRTAVWQTDGFYLNGRKCRIVGLNRHQSYPYIGYAATRSLQRFDAEILKNELGLNAVRTSHYPQSQHFIDRCDELGLLVFTEIPGWQHIGGEAWKKQTVKNTEEMVLQYRNHPSVILWGVRINESVDDDPLYRETNRVARQLDPTRATGGVRCNKKSSLLEDVYTYNDFFHDGSNPGCEPKKAVTSDKSRPYLITEYNGHMFPTKTYDSEEHRLSHALRHANVLDAAAGEEDIAGTFGWCFADYNTHKDFGSGDRICYHGVLDMFRNPKLAAAVYGVRQDDAPVLAVSSSMDIGEHPAGNRGRTFLFTNADSVKMYKNRRFIREYTHKDTPYKHLFRPPIEIDDFLGEQIEDNERFSPTQARYTKDLLNHSARFGMNHLPLSLKLKAAWLMARYGMTFGDAYALYGKYIGNWGDAATVYRFDAVRDGKTVATVEKAPTVSLHLSAQADHTRLREGDTYDMSLIRITMRDQNDNILPFYQGCIRLSAEGPIRIVGPTDAILRGGMGGAIVRTTGGRGRAALVLSCDQTEPLRVEFTVFSDENGGIE